jgi:hypothetical protein
MGSTLPHETGGGDGIYGGVKESAPRPRGGPGSQWGKGPWRLVAESEGKCRKRDEALERVLFQQTKRGRNAMSARK